MKLFIFLVKKKRKKVSKIRNLKINLKFCKHQRKLAEFQKKKRVETKTFLHHSPLHQSSLTYFPLLSRSRKLPKRLERPVQKDWTHSSWSSERRLIKIKRNSRVVCAGRAAIRDRNRAKGSRPPLHPFSTFTMPKFKRGVSSYKLLATVDSSIRCNKLPTRLLRRATLLEAFN